VANIIPFTFDKLSIRLIITENSQELFVAKDIAKLLGYKDTDQAIRQHCKNAKSYPVNLTGQVRNTKLIPESDVWRLIIKSRLAEAEKIENWIMEEVLPTIRKTGSYSLEIEKPKLDLTELLEDSKKALELIHLFENENPVNLIKLDRFMKNNEKTSPLELLEMDFKNSYFIPVELGNIIGKSPVEINQLLAKNGFQFRENGVWKTTEKGKEFSISFQNGSYFQIKWKLEVLI